VCVSVCPRHYGALCKTAEPIEIPLWIKTQVDPREGGNFGELSAPFKSIGNIRCIRRCRVRFKGIIQSPITSCSRRDHSVCQASANSILKISGRKWCGLSDANGVVGLHSAGEVWYLRLPCLFSNWNVYKMRCICAAEAVQSGMLTRPEVSSEGQECEIIFSSKCQSWSSFLISSHFRCSLIN